MAPELLWSQSRYRGERRKARPAPRRALLANATDLNASPTPGRFRRIPDAPAGDGYIALRPTLRADPFAINSRWRISVWIVGACGFLATAPRPATAACEILLVNGNGPQTSATTSHAEIPESHSGAANRVTPWTL
jgi:hypothetical protein